VVKIGKHIVGPNNWSKMESRESWGSLNDDLLDAHMFQVHDIIDLCKEIIDFMTIDKAPEDYTYM